MWIVALPEPESEHDKGKPDGQRSGDHQDVMSKNRRKPPEGSRGKALFREVFLYSSLPLYHPLYQLTPSWILDLNLKFATSRY